MISTKNTKTHEEKELILGEECYAIVGAAIEVHCELGPGFLEAIYQEALEIELGSRRIPFEAQKQLTVAYKGQRLKKEYRADIICYGQIIVELKAMDRLTGKEESQILNYLKATWQPRQIGVAKICQLTCPQRILRVFFVFFVDEIFSGEPRARLRVRKSETLGT